MKSLKLNVLEQNQLKNQEMNAIQGGEVYVCTCSCHWAGNTGSSIEANRDANVWIRPGGGESQHGNNQHINVTVTHKTNS